VLVDLSMPVLDGTFMVVFRMLGLTVPVGVGATVQIRDIEALRKKDNQSTVPLQDTRILALTGMSSLEDKRRAFEAGVDG
jgi:CheY-like chemotaxis protein